MNPQFICIQKWPGFPPHTQEWETIRASAWSTSLRSSMWECHRALVWSSLWRAGNHVINDLHALVCVNACCTPWSVCRNTWRPPLPLTSIWGDGAEPRAACLLCFEFVFQSAGIYTSVCSIVLLLNVGQSSWKALRYVWEEYCIAPAWPPKPISCIWQVTKSS